MTPDDELDKVRDAEERFWDQFEDKHGAIDRTLSHIGRIKRYFDLIDADDRKALGELAELAAFRNKRANLIPSNEDDKVREAEERFWEQFEARHGAIDRTLSHTERIERYFALVDADDRKMLGELAELRTMAIREKYKRLEDIDPGDLVS